MIGTVADIEAQVTEISVEHEWHGASDKTMEPFVAAFLERRDNDRMFLPFTPSGRDLLVTILADRRFTAPPFFAFGTNSDVLAQLGKQGQIDVVSFFKTERASFRNRRTNSVSGNIDGDDDDDTNPEPSMALRAAFQDERSLRSRMPNKTRAEDDEELDEETLVGSDSISIRAFKNKKNVRPFPKAEASDEHDDANDSTILTMRQVRDRIRAEEAAAKQTETGSNRHDPNPLHWLIHLVSSLISPNKPK